MEYFELSKEMILGAKTYMPLVMKEKLGRDIARSCLSAARTSEQNRIRSVPLPDLMEENAALKSVLLLNTLLGYYFDIELKETDNPYETYDYFAGGHLLNQIERFKSDRETKNAAFDILDDFREFRKITDTILFNEKAKANDPISRLDAAITLLATPENILAMVEELKSATDELTEKADRAKVLGAIPETEA